MFLVLEVLDQISLIVQVFQDVLQTLMAISFLVYQKFLDKIVEVFVEIFFLLVYKNEKALDQIYLIVQVFQDVLETLMETLMEIFVVIFVEIFVVQQFQV